MNAEDTTIGRDAVTHGNNNNIAGYQLVGLETLDFAVAMDFGFVCAVLLKGGDGLLGRRLLRYTDYGVEDKDGEDLRVVSERWASR